MMPDLEERCVLWVRGVLTRDAAATNGLEWLERTTHEARRYGGRVELTLGMSAIISFDGIELEDAASLARHLVAMAIESTPEVSVHIGLSLGEIARVPESLFFAVVGSAFDRAQVLSQRARAGEIVFDEAAEQRGEELFLFAREIFAERVRGHVLEPTHWSKRLCRAALQHLKPAPLPQSALPVFDELRVLSMRPGQQRIALHSAARSAAFDCIEYLLLIQPPSLRLEIAGGAGALRPLGSLALALQRLWPTLNDLQGAPLPETLRANIHALCEGRAISRADAAALLTSLLFSHMSADDRPCLVLEELTDIDPATMGVVAEVLMTPDLDALILMTLSLDASVPAQLLPAENLHELYLPPLPAEDRAAIAEAVLSLPSGSEIAQRVAMLGGTSAQGVVEAVRTLVSSGDLVLRDEGFVWRVGPRQGAANVPVEALITERVVGLTPSAYRVLEVLCCCPRLAQRDFVAAVAARDGMDVEEFAAGLDPLALEGFLETADMTLSLGAADAAVRGALRNVMPPARTAEMHRFVAEELRARTQRGNFGSGEIAFHLAEGGLSADAASALVEAAHAAMDAGFQRIALRLLATAVEWDPSTQIRKAASELARSVTPAALKAAPSSQPPDAGYELLGEDEYEELKSEDFERPSSMAKGAMRSAVTALIARDHEAVERFLDAAIAAGGGRAAAQRVLALSLLGRGDVEAAMRVLQRGDDSPPAVRARDLLCWSLVRLAAGDADDAVRAAFKALALGRQLGDVRGEAASLRVLALGYRTRGRIEDAGQLDAAADRTLQAPSADSHPS
jgi:tetratricopeptide (TPR) repeat protein